MPGPPTEQLPISVTMIACNQELNLRRCLPSFAGWVSEIILVTNDCRDATAAVATQFGARVFDHPWHGHRDQKNIALDYASQPWVLALDSDEAVSPRLANSIATFIIADDPQWNGAACNRTTWFINRWIRHGDWYPDRKLRLFRRGKGHWGGVTEHDKIVLEGKASRLDGDLLHYSFPDLRSYHERQPVYVEAFFEREAAESRPRSFAESALRPVWRFLRAYFLRLGFLDGFPGLYIALATSYFTLYRYGRLYEHSSAEDAPNWDKMG